MSEKPENKTLKRLQNSLMAIRGIPTIPGFTFLREGTYSCGGVTNTVREYGHNETGMEFVLIAGGSFMMGSQYEKPIHRVNLSPFLISKYLCTQAVIPTMIKQGSGSILNTTSPAARDRTIPLVGVAYSVAKAAIEQFTHVVSAEIGKYNIAVNCYYPWQDVASEGLMFNVPPGFDTSRFVTPEYMVKASLFLAKQDGKGITGTVASAEEIIVKHNL